MRVANPWAADRPAGGWPPEGHIVITPYRTLNYYPFSVCLIMAFTCSDPLVKMHFDVKNTTKLHEIKDNILGQLATGATQVFVRS
jgi:hypothetical protein